MYFCGYKEKVLMLPCHSFLNSICIFNHLHPSSFPKSWQHFWPFTLRKILPHLHPRVVVCVIITLLSLPDLGGRQQNICYQMSSM